MSPTLKHYKGTSPYKSTTGSTGLGSTIITRTNKLSLPCCLFARAWCLISPCGFKMAWLQTEDLDWSGFCERTVSMPGLHEVCKRQTNHPGLLSFLQGSLNFQRQSSLARGHLTRSNPQEGQVQSQYVSDSPLVVAESSRPSLACTPKPLRYPLWLPFAICGELFPAESRDIGSMFCVSMPVARRTQIKC